MAELRDTKVPAGGYEPIIERIRQVVEEAFEVRKRVRSRVVGAHMYHNDANIMSMDIRKFIYLSPGRSPWVQWC